MKCPKCKHDMVRVEAKKGVYYYECKHCHHTIGKPKENGKE